MCRVCGCSRPGHGHDRDHGDGHDHGHHHGEHDHRHDGPRRTLQLEADLLARNDRLARELRCYLVPITTAYALAGRLRASWSGFTGGERADGEIAAFFAELDARGQLA